MPRKQFKTIISEARMIGELGLQEAINLVNGELDDLHSKYNLKSDTAKISVASGVMHYNLGELGPNHRVRKVWRVDYLDEDDDYQEIPRCVNARHISQWNDNVQ